MFGNGRIIPSGPLRESLDNLNKYKNIVVNGNQKDEINNKSFFSENLKKLNFYNSTYHFINLNDFNVDDSFIVFSGIGNHNTFLEMLLLNKFKILKDLEYPDHYNYSKMDIDEIISLAKKLNAKILTTEKDYLRLQENLRQNINYVKINLKINQLNEIKNKLDNLYESV